MREIKSAIVVHRVEQTAEASEINTLTKVIDETTGEIIAESGRTYTDVSRPIAAKLALDKAYELARDNGFEQVGRVITTEPIY
ncbi:hypothetical protein [Evansella halocellulosilytica]|uniref:hypothetical protein n=1 Tax=Evansella halocellulosilytica TaxID=2011013 RepID=UPI000BB8BDF1|nr:hypothetical protein [Evansella halocellulosilytica]